MYIYYPTNSLLALVYYNPSNAAHVLLNVTKISDKIVDFTFRNNTAIDISL